MPNTVTPTNVTPNAVNSKTVTANAARPSAAAPTAAATPKAVTVGTGLLTINKWNLVSCFQVANAAARWADDRGGDAGVRDGMRAAPRARRCDGEIHVIRLQTAQ